MDERDTVAAFNDLISRYPDLSMTLVSDVLQSCDQDIDRAYGVLSEMVIPPEHQSHEQSQLENLPVGVTSTTSTPVITTPPRPSHLPSAKMPSPNVRSLPRFAPSHRSQRDTHHNFDTNASHRSLTPHTAPPPALRGHWAGNNIGRRYRIDQLCTKYSWIERKVVEKLFEKYADCVDLVENDILHMFPIDEPIAFAAPSASPSRRPRTNTPSHNQRALANALRMQDANEMSQAASSDGVVSVASPAMIAMRQRLWDARDTLGRLHHLANQTRKPSHVATAKEKEEELQRLSDAFLTGIRQSVEYRSGVVDVHGLTKEEAIQLVEWKMQDGGRKRFRLITGKGNHSHRYQAVLKPALEKHFRSRRVAFTQIEDGVMSVNVP